MSECSVWSRTGELDGRVGKRQSLLKIKMPSDVQQDRTVTMRVRQVLQRQTPDRRFEQRSVEPDARHHSTARNGHWQIASRGVLAQHIDGSAHIVNLHPMQRLPKQIETATNLRLLPCVRIPRTPANPTRCEPCNDRLRLCMKTISYRLLAPFIPILVAKKPQFD